MFAKVAETGSIGEDAKWALLSSDDIVNYLHELEEGVGRKLVTIDGDRVAIEDGLDKFVEWAKFIAEAERKSLALFDIDLFFGKAEAVCLA